MGGHLCGGGSGLCCRLSPGDVGNVWSKIVGDRNERPLSARQSVGGSCFVNHQIYFYPFKHSTQHYDHRPRSSFEKAPQKIIGLANTTLAAMGADPVIIKAVKIHEDM